MSSTQTAVAYTHARPCVGVKVLDQISYLTQSMLSQVLTNDAKMGSGAVYTQSDEAGFSGRQNLSAGVHQKKVESHEFDAVYADEAALPSFAQMAAAQGPHLAGGPQLWSEKQSRLQSRGQVNDCSLLNDRCVRLFNSVDTVQWQVAHVCEFTTQENDRYSIFPLSTLVGCSAFSLACSSGAWALYTQYRHYDTT